MNTWNLSHIKWQEVGSDGTKYTLLEGSREAGLFSYAFFIPAGFWDAPHWHTQDARVAVISGALHLGYGEQHDSNRLEIHPAGSFLLVPANVKHFDGSTEDTLIVGVAQGQWRTHYVDSSRTASAGTQS